jgi:aerobic-type carbon monoxide dehydrogenase small subunit (CoxS/CutS family)
LPASIRLTVNGKRHDVKTEPNRPLLEVLREDLGLTGAKYGCGEGQCRACTVLINDRPVTSCRLPVQSAAGKRIVTIEGLAPNGTLHPVQQAFIDEGAMQCGYCVPGMILTATAFLKTNSNPDDAQINTAMNGNLCRCCGYTRIVAAIRRAAGKEVSNVSGQE